MRTPGSGLLRCMGTNLALSLVTHALVKLFLRPADFHSACQNSANNTTVCFGFDDQDSLLSVSPILHLAHATLTLCRCSRWHFASVQSVLPSGLLPGCGNSGADVVSLSSPPSPYAEPESRLCMEIKKAKSANGRRYSATQMF